MTSSQVWTYLSRKSPPSTPVSPDNCPCTTACGSLRLLLPFWLGCLPVSLTRSAVAKQVPRFPPRHRPPRSPAPPHRAGSVPAQGVDAVQPPHGLAGLPLHPQLAGPRGPPHGPPAEEHPRGGGRGGHGGGGEPVLLPRQHGDRDGALPGQAVVWGAADPLPRGGGGGAYLGRQGGPTLPLGVPYRCLGRTGTGSFARCLERVQKQLEAKTRGGKVAPALLFPEYIPCWAAGAGTGRRCHRGWALQHFPGVQPRPTSFLGPPE